MLSNVITNMEKRNVSETTPGDIRVEIARLKDGVDVLDSFIAKNYERAWISH